MQPNFQKFLSRKHALLTDDILIRAWNDQKRFGNLTDIREYVQNLEIIGGDFYFDQNWVNEIIRKYNRKPVSFFQKFIKRGIFHGEKLKSFALGLRINGKSILRLEKDFWISVELLKNLLVFLPQTHPLAKIAELRVAEIIKTRGVSKDDINSVLLAVSYPRKYNGPVLEQRDLSKIKKMAENNPRFDIFSAVKKHAKKYAYLGYREPFSKGYAVSFFLKKLKESESIRGKHNAIKFTAPEKKHIELLQDFVYFRNYRTEKLYEALYYFEPLWLTIGKHFGVNGNGIGYYTLAELKKLFDDYIKVSASEINKRKNGYGILLHNNGISFIIDRELQAKKTDLAGNHERVKEINGMTACKGLARGRAKIVLNASEQKKVKAGDILVARMTTPDFVPSMKRAAAFITDEGGITCHAAIISRELGKPCIIGAKIATKVLKDGDLVEVDADRGIVRIIKNA